MTFSGLESSVWAFASAVAMAATLSLDRCMAELHVHEVEADSTRLGAFGTDAVAHCLLGILRHQRLKFAFGALVFIMSFVTIPKQFRKFRPGVGRTHVDDTDGFDPRLRRLAIEQHRG